MLATEACRLDPRGDRTVTGLLALEDVPTEECTNHRLVDMCGISHQVATEYCRDQAKWAIYQIGMLHIERFYPIGGILVEDQQYNYVGDPPPGFVLPETLSPDAENMECYVHVEDVEVKTLEELIEEALNERREEQQAQNGGTAGDTGGGSRN